MPLSRGQRTRSLAAAIASIAALGVTLGLTLPLLSLALEARGHSSTMIGLNATAQFLGILVFSPRVPRLIARFRILPVMAVAVAASVAALALFPFLDWLVAWFALRFVLGCAEGALFICGETWINEIADDRSRGRIIGVYGTFLAAGLAAGPLIIEVTGVDGARPFLVGAALIALALPPLLLARGLTPHFEGRPSRSLWQLSRILPVVAVAAIAFGWLDSGAFSLLPLYGVDIGMTPAAAARLVTALAVGGIALLFPIGWLADRMDRTRLLGRIAALGALALAATPALSATPIALYAILFVIGGVIGGLWTLSLVMLGERFAGPDLAAMNVVMALLYGLGSTIGPSLLGVAMSAWPPHGLMAAMAAACVVVAGFALTRKQR